MVLDDDPIPNNYYTEKFCTCGNELFTVAEKMIDKCSECIMSDARIYDSYGDPKELDFD